MDSSAADMVESLVRGLRVMGLGARPSDEDEQIVRWARDALLADPALEAAEREAANGGAVSGEVRRRLAAAVADELAAAASGAGGALTGGMPSVRDSTRARGSARMENNRLSISNHGVSGSVRNSVTTTNRSTVVAIGGGLVLAVVLAVIWVQWTGREDSRSVETAFRQRAAVACQQISATYVDATVVLPSDAGAQPQVSTAEGADGLERAAEVVQRQASDLEAQPVPQSLSARLEGALDAARRLVDATPAAAAALRGAGPTIPFDDLRRLGAGPEFAPLVTARSSLEQALADLSGVGCSFEPR